MGFALVPLNSITKKHKIFRDLLSYLRAVVVPCLYKRGV